MKQISEEELIKIITDDSKEFERGVKSTHRLASILFYLSIGTTLAMVLVDNDGVFALATMSGVFLIGYAIMSLWELRLLDSWKKYLEQWQETLEVDE